MTINCRGTLLDLTSPQVMGILNVTPDSFYDGGKATTATQIRARVIDMIEAGAAIIDVGGMSSKPGAVVISEQEEIDRVSPAIEIIREVSPTTIISIDTLHSQVASHCLSHGASIVNDISAGDYDKDMIQIVAEADVPYIAMHMQGTPSDMQDNPLYQDVTLDVLKYMAVKVRECRAAGIKDVVLDVGFGFGKSVQHNYKLLAELSAFRILGCPILAGVSRKSMIYKPLGITPQEALSGTSALHMVALQQGAKILRVHDVRETVQCVKLHQLITDIN